jgi:hypothetical protein
MYRAHSAHGRREVESWRPVGPATARCRIKSMQRCATESSARRAGCRKGLPPLIASSAARKSRRRADRRSTACACASIARTRMIGRPLASADTIVAGVRTANFGKRYRSRIASAQSFAEDRQPAAQFGGPRRSVAEYQSAARRASEVVPRQGMNVHLALRQPLDEGL